TQQPSAIDSRVLSQLDIIMTHKLVFDDDVKAVFKRTPTIIPLAYKKSNFIKTLPVGVALTGDRQEETSRAFVMRIRPRMSQHEGRDAETNQQTFEVTEEQAETLISELAYKKIEREKSVSKKELDKFMSELNEKYKSNYKFNELIKVLTALGIIVEENALKFPDDETTVKEEKIEEIPISTENPEQVLQEEKEQTETELVALPTRLNSTEIKQIADKYRKKKTLLVFGHEEYIQSIQLKYRTIWNVNYEAYDKKNEFTSRDTFIDAMTGEFLHFTKDKFIESTGFPEIAKLKEDEIRVFRQLSTVKTSLKEISLPTGLDEEKVRNVLDKLISKGFAERIANENTGLLYSLSSRIYLPKNPTMKILESVKELPFVQLSTASKEKENYSKKEIITLLHLLWPNIMVKKISEVQWPMYFITLIMNGEERKIAIDAFKGQRIH
ncbi:MAG: hypothetical protein Q7K42_06010, partial [Candidatus Diapherotrites archaeon]|nr:hypothetical protein [Candidatus Diapherotrites archaeon]